MKRSSATLLAAAFLMLVAGTALAQDSNVSANITGVFGNQVSGNGLNQTATNSAGLLLSYRYFFNRHSGFEASYGYTKNSQDYTDQFGNLFAVQAGVHELTGAYVLRGGRGPIQPFALVGGGILIFNPTTATLNSTVLPIDRQTRPAFLYGGGVDVRLSRAVALRAQYRGLVYEAPDFQDSVDLHTGAAMHTAEPSVGLVFKF